MIECWNVGIMECWNNGMVFEGKTEIRNQKSENRKVGNPRLYLSTMRIYFVTIAGLVFNGSSMGLQWVLGKMKSAGWMNA